jgi:inorganic pyrophosphatase
VNDKDKLKAIEKVQTLLIHLGALEELAKQCREELLQYAKTYKLSIDFQEHKVTDWGDLKGE